MVEWLGMRRQVRFPLVLSPVEGGGFLLYVFIGCLAFGAFFSILSLIFGGHGFDHSVDHAGGAHHAGEGPSPFNPLVIASAITTFGAVGLIAQKGFGIGSLMSTILALGFAGAIGAAIFFGIVRLMYNSQSNSVFSLEDLVDTEAEVLTPIPEKGLGEIAYVANGIRYTLSARSMDEQGIRRGAEVIIRELSGNVAVVQQKLTIDDIELTQEEYRESNEKPRSNA